MCMRQSRKVMWDTINTLFLTLYLFLLLSFNNCKHKSMDSSAILANIFEEQWAKNHPQYLSELPHVLFPTTFLEIAVVKLLKQSGRQFWDSLFALRWRCLFICWKQVLWYLFNIHMSGYLLCYNNTANWLQLIYTVHSWMSTFLKIFVSVGAARTVSPNWSHEAMACHSSDCFSIVWGQVNAPSVTSLPSSCHMTHDIENCETFLVQNIDS